MSFADEQVNLGSSDNERNTDVIIVGAGAVGLLTALKLGRAGVETLVIEAYNDILQAPRAIAYMPVVTQELEKLGILDKLKEKGMMNTQGITWRQLDGKEHATLSPQQHILTLGQDQLARTVLDTLVEECPSVEIIFGHRCVGLAQIGEKVKIMTTRDQDEYLFEAKFLVGCDGANSTTRRMSMIPFEGFTWRNFRFVASDVQYDFVEHCGFGLANFIVDPDHWAVIAKTGKENIWRVCYGEQPETSPDEESIYERAQSRISSFIKASNKDGNFDYSVKRLKPYWAHQKCAKVFRQGNLLLAGDAAHSNNPIGGLGLTSGILDAVVVGNVLARHLKNGEPDELITKGLESRRETWLKVSDPISQMNFRRLFSTEQKEISERDWFFGKLNEPDREFIDLIASFNDLLPHSFE